MSLPVIFAVRASEWCDCKFENENVFILHAVKENKRIPELI